MQGSATRIDIAYQQTWQRKIIVISFNYFSMFEKQFDIFFVHVSLEHTADSMNSVFNAVVFKSIIKNFSQVIHIFLLPICFPC